jgi:hypothetical protein
MSPKEKALAQLAVLRQDFFVLSNADKIISITAEFLTD